MTGISTMNWKQHTPGKLNTSSSFLLPFYMIMKLLQQSVNPLTHSRLM